MPFFMRARARARPLCLSVCRLSVHHRRLGPVVGRSVGWSGRSVSVRLIERIKVTVTFFLPLYLAVCVTADCTRTFYGDLAQDVMDCRAPTEEFKHSCEVRLKMTMWWLVLSPAELLFDSNNSMHSNTLYVTSMRSREDQNERQELQFLHTDSVLLVLGSFPS